MPFKVPPVGYQTAAELFVNSGGSGFYFKTLSYK